MIFDLISIIDSLENQKFFSCVHSENLIHLEIPFIFFFFISFHALDIS